MELFLQILSTAGFIILIVIAVLAALIAAVLFLPVVYRIKIKKIDKFGASGNVRWLFGAVFFSFSFGEKGPEWNLRIFGFPVGRLLQKNKRRVKAGNEEFAPAKKQPTIKPGERIDAGPEDQVFGGNGGKRRGGMPDGTGRETDDGAKTGKIRFTFQGICDKLKKAGELKAVFDKAKPILAKLVKAILPKKISGYIDFGFDDPAATGILLAVVGALCIPVPEKLKVTPFFNEKKFECDVNMTGRIFIIVLIVNIINLFRIREVRQLLGKAFPAKGRAKKNRRKKK